MEKIPVDLLRSSLPAVAKLAAFSNGTTLWVDHDKSADVLYISFGRPQKADQGVHDANDIIWRKQGKKLVGVTVLRASRFLRAS